MPVGASHSTVWYRYKGAVSVLKIDSADVVGIAVREACFSSGLADKATFYYFERKDGTRIRMSSKISDLTTSEDEPRTSIPKILREW